MDVDGTVEPKSEDEDDPTFNAFIREQGRTQVIEGVVVVDPDHEDIPVCVSNLPACFTTRVLTPPLRRSRSTTA